MLVPEVFYSLARGSHMVTPVYSGQEEELGERELDIFNKQHSYDCCTQSISFSLIYFTYQRVNTFIS
jgi:hypothetical protein